MWASEGSSPHHRNRATHPLREENTTPTRIGPQWVRGVDKKSGMDSGGEGGDSHDKCANDQINQSFLVRCHAVVMLKWSSGA
jgi:hypothetical protein